MSERFTGLVVYCLKTVDTFRGREKPKDVVKENMFLYYEYIFSVMT